MTVTSTTRTAGPYTGTGAVKNYPFAFKVFSGSDLLVQQTVGGVVQTLAYGPDYDVVLNADQDANPGGTIKLGTALPSGATLAAASQVPLTQSTDLQNAGGFYPQTLEDALDRLTILVQQLNVTYQTVLRAPDIDGLHTLPSASARAGQLLAFDANGDPITAGPVAGTATALAASLAAGGGAATVGTQPAGSTKARTVQAVLDERVYVSNWPGFTGNGVADDTAAWQACIDANKGKLIVLPSAYTSVVAGVLLSGTAYNDTRILIEGTVLLKADGGAANFGGAWVGFIFQSCFRCGIDIAGTFDGNRTAMTDSEHIYCIGLAGVTDWHAPQIKVKGLRGDGLYVNQADWTTSSTNSTNVTIGVLRGVNTGDDGRNLLSIISCDGFSCDEVHSYRVGGTVGGKLQPGGVDIEPNFGYQSCTDITFGLINVVTAGNSGFNIAGKAVTSDATRDWNVARVNIGTAQVRLTGSGFGAQMTRCADVRFTLGVRCTGNAEPGYQADYADRVYGRVMVTNAATAIYLGYNDWLQDFHLDIDIQGYAGPGAGLFTCGVNRGLLTGRISGATAGTSAFAIYTNNNSRSVTQTNVVYKVDCPFDGLNNRAFHNDATHPVTYGTGTYVADCDWTGYSAFNVQCDAAIPTFNVRGRNKGSGVTTAPTNGAWVQGDEVTFKPSAGGVAPGAICIASGSPGTWKNLASIAA